MKRIMTCGGQGFVGSAFIREAVKQGYEVIDISELPKEINRLDGVNCGVDYFDINDSEALSHKINHLEPDIFVNFCIRLLGASFTNPHSLHESIVKGTITILEAINYQRTYDHEIKYVQISSSEVYGTATQFPTKEDHPMRPSTLYSSCKAAADLITLSYHRCYDIPTVIVRPFNQIGERANINQHANIITKNFIRMMQKKNPIIYGTGRQTRDFSDTRDTAKGIIKAIECEELVGHTVNLGYGQDISMNELTYMMMDIIHEYEGIRGLRIEYRHKRLGDNTRMCADITRAKSYLNWRPQISLMEGLRRSYDWLKTTIKMNPELLKKIGNDK